jgi:hypothetical protein
MYLSKKRKRKLIELVYTYMYADADWPIYSLEPEITKDVLELKLGFSILSRYCLRLEKDLLGIA